MGNQKHIPFTLLKLTLLELSFLKELNELIAKLRFANHFKYCYARIFSLILSKLGSKMINPNLQF